MMYYCELAQNHYGPCATFSSKESVQTRVNWEEHNPDKKYTVRDTTIIASTNEGK